MSYKGVYMNMLGMKGTSMKHVETKCRINASAETVWSLITDADLLQTSNLGIKKIEGKIRAGEKLKLWSEVSPDRAFALKVVEFDVNQRMVWKGGMPFGLFKGVRQFNLSESDGLTEFHIREEFSGPLSSMIWKSMPDLNPSFEILAGGIKRLAEGRAA